MLNILQSKQRWTLLVFCALAFMGCKKDDGNKEETPSNVSPKLSAQVDGNSFTATTIALDEEDGIYTLSGLAAGDKTITLVFNNTNEGNYTLTFDEVSMVYSVGAIAWTGGPTAGGSITITDNANGKLKGNFQAVLDELLWTGTSVQITSGIFEGIAY
jgi:Family of unknown function (DUF6252)